MKECRKKQWCVEHDYVTKEYFSNIENLTTPTKVSRRPATLCDVLFGNKLYACYKYELGGMLLIPKTDDLFKGDFDFIYEYHCSKEGLLFTITSKKNGIIENYYYLFSTNDYQPDKDYVNSKFIYSTINDSENKLYKKYLEENVTEELFLINRGYDRLDLNKSENIVELKKYDNGVCDVHEYNVFNGISDNMKLGRVDLAEGKSLLETITNLHAKKINR